MPPKRLSVKHVITWRNPQADGHAWPSRAAPVPANRSSQRPVSGRRLPQPSCPWRMSKTAPRTISIIGLVWSPCDDSSRRPAHVHAAVHTWVAGGVWTIALGQGLMHSIAERHRAVGQVRSELAIAVLRTEVDAVKSTHGSKATVLVRLLAPAALPEMIRSRLCSRLAFAAALMLAGCTQAHNVCHPGARTDMTSGAPSVQPYIICCRMYRRHMR